MFLPGVQHRQPSARIRMLQGRYDGPTTPMINIQFEKQYKQIPNVHQTPFQGTITDSGWQGIDRIQ